jgi:hypothetical protein
MTTELNLGDASTATDRRRCARTPVKRRIAQYSLRTLLIAILVASVPLAAVTRAIARRRAEDAAEAAISRLGGFSAPREVGACEEPVPSAIVDFVNRLFPRDPSEEIFGVSLRDSKRARDKDIKVLHAFRALGMLDLGNTFVTDACIGDLEVLRSLVWLDVTGTDITNSGVARLKRRLPNCNIFMDSEKRADQPAREKG